MKKKSKFDDFKNLLSWQVIKEDKLPNEDSIKWVRGVSFGLIGLYFVRMFYSVYVRTFGLAFIQDKIKTLKNKTAKIWADYAISRIPLVVEYDNAEFDANLEDLLCRLHLPVENIAEVFEPYKPFFTNYDYFRFAFDNIDSPLYHYFYILLIILYEGDYPTNLTKEYSYKFDNCPENETCGLRKKCEKYNNKCYYIRLMRGENYDFEGEMHDFQKEMTLDFLSLAPEDKKEVLLVKFYESLQQVNQTGLFKDKLSLSYDKVLYREGRPLTGCLYIRWDKVEFFNGFYLVKHPNVPFNKVPPYRIDDPNCRKAFNDISSLFLKKLPPLCVETKGGRVIKVLNKVNLTSCISLMEHRVSALNVIWKKKIDHAKLEKKELTSTEAMKLCKDIKSRYLDYLCAKQLDGYKVICSIEHRVHSNGSVSCDYSFIFTVKETASKVFLAYESASESRCTYLLPVSRNSWKGKHRQNIRFLCFK